MLGEGYVYNVDETHFKIDTNSRKTVAMCGDDSVKYADFVSGDNGITIIVMLGGSPDETIKPPILIFQNKSSNNPISGVPDNVPGVVYRTDPKGWMDKWVLVQWIHEQRIFSSLPAKNKIEIFLDNAGCHAESEEVKCYLENWNMESRYLPKNATDLCQPVDSFIIYKIKNFWRRMWDVKRMKMVTNDEWNDWTKGSGKLPNPGKSFFLQLASNCSRQVAMLRDGGGVLYTGRR